MITVTLIGPGHARSVVKISADATIRDVATSQYHLFWRSAKRNGVRVVAFTTRVQDGDVVTVEEMSERD